MAKMGTITLKSQYQNRKSCLFRESLYLNTVRLLKERSGQGPDPITKYAATLNGLFERVTKFDDFKSLENAFVKYKEKLKDAKDKKDRLKIARALVKGVAVFDILLKGFDESFTKQLEKVNISLEQKGKENSTLSTYHSKIDQGNKKDTAETGTEDKEEETSVTPEMMKDVILKIKSHFSPSNERYASLLDLPDNEKIFDLDLFRVNLENATILQLKGLRTVIITSASAIKSIDVSKLSSDQNEGSVNKFEEYVIKLIKNESFGDSNGFQKAIGLPPGAAGKQTLKSFFDAIEEKVGVVNFSKMSEREQKSRVEKIPASKAIEKIDVLLGLMRKKLVT